MSGDSLPDDFLKNFDVQLQEFYHRVVCKELSLQTMCNAHGINRALKEVVDAYRKETVNNCDSSISFDSSWRRCAYVIKHSTCFTTAVASYLLKLVNKNKNVLRESLRNRRLNICCLGGGPATDAVAVIKIVRGLYFPLWLRTRKKLAIQVTVVDLSKDWNETAKNVFHCLEETPEFFGEDELILSYKFIKADLTQTMSDDVITAINSADILTLIYFLSAVNCSKEKEKSPQMMDNIVLNMQKGACLFFLDSAANVHYETLNKVAGKRRSMQEIYGPLVEEFHTISLESVKKFTDLYAKNFKKFFCMTNIFLCVSSWYKMKTIQARIKLNKEVALKPIEWAKPSQEQSDELTEQMKTYRKTVRNVVNAKQRFYQK